MIGLLALPNTSYTDTIYSWRGKDGALRFSNAPPPEGVTDYQTTTSEISGGSDQNPTNQRRASYDAMVKKASSEADRSIIERQKREAAVEAEKKRITEEKRKARIQAQRKELEQQIEAIKNRAVSPTMPNGMKQAQIEALKKEIEKLEDGSETGEGTTQDPGANTEKSSKKY